MAVFVISTASSLVGVITFFRGGTTYQCEGITLTFYQSYRTLRVVAPGGERFLECTPLSGQNYNVVLCAVEYEEAWTSYLLFDLSSTTVYPAVSKEELTQEDCSLAGLYYSPDLNLCVHAREARRCGLVK